RRGHDRRSQPRRLRPCRLCLDGRRPAPAPPRRCARVRHGRHPQPHDRPRRRPVPRGQMVGTRQRGRPRRRDRLHGAEGGARGMTHELKTGGQHGYLRIATEEAFATEEQLEASLRLVKEGRADKGTQSLWGFYGTSPSERTTFIRERLLDLGPLRLQAMDAAGIDKAVLALTSPGTQSMHDADEAKRIACNANDHLKAACEAHPDRFYGMAAIAPLDPD